MKFKITGKNFPKPASVTSKMLFTPTERLNQSNYVGSFWLDEVQGFHYTDMAKYDVHVLHVEDPGVIWLKGGTNGREEEHEIGTIADALMSDAENQERNLIAAWMVLSKGYFVIPEPSDNYPYSNIDLSFPSTK